MKRHLKWYGFLYVLAFLFLFSIVGQFAAQLTEVASDAADHGEKFAWVDFWPKFLAATFENWQSEFLQLLVQAMGMVVLAGVIFKRSEADKKRMEAKIDEILAAAKTSKEA